MCIRVGIHSGEAVSGVVGVDNYAFDVWGRSVNQAHRIEENGIEERVNVSGDTWQFLWPFFNGSYRGKIPVKNMGAIDMYDVEGLKSKYENQTNINQVSSFWRRVKIHCMQKEQYEKLEQDVMLQMHTKLDQGYTYHCTEHTVEVLDNVDKLIEFSEHEITDSEYLILKTAALFHDFGYIDDQNSHEDRSAELCREWLPKYGYNAEDIEIICETILATNLFSKAENKLQEIIVDADLFYLGTDNYTERADHYRSELAFQGKTYNDADWAVFQLKFLSSHSYYTNYGKNTLEQKKQETISLLSK